MTGEVTLRGRVLPIGGLKEKILAAKRAKIGTVILPQRNEKDIEEIPKHLLRGVKLIFATTMDDVLKAGLRSASALLSKKPRPARRSGPTRLKKKELPSPRRNQRTPSIAPSLSLSPPSSLR